jgi:hypothetical protein
LSKQQNLSREVKIFLALGFDSLDRPAQAVELLTSIPPPAEKNPGDPPKPPVDNAPEAEKTKYEAARAKYEQDKTAYDSAMRTYWFKQLSEARALRKAGSLEADKEKRVKYFQDADKLLDEMIGTSKSPGWAFNSLEARREKIFVLEDQNLFRPALSKWTEMLQPFRKFSSPPKDAKEARIREAYYEVRFYMTRLIYKSQLKVKDEKKKLAAIRTLADQIVDLEKNPKTADFGGANVKKLYEDWLEDEELMRKAYQAAGGKSLLPSNESAVGSP